jgi:hypothetical protein
VNDTEAQDLAEMLDKVREIKLNCFDLLRSIDRADARELETSGFGGKTQAEAMQGFFKQYLRDIERLHAAHLKKYPD